MGIIGKNKELRSYHGVKYERRDRTKKRASGVKERYREVIDQYEFDIHEYVSDNDKTILNFYKALEDIRCSSGIFTYYHYSNSRLIALPMSIDAKTYYEFKFKTNLGNTVWLRPVDGEVQFYME